MSQKNPVPFPSSQPSSRRVFLAGVDPVTLVELLDDHYDDNGGADGSAYRRLYEESKAASLAHDVEAVNFAALLSSVDASAGVEDAMRRAGFIVGFETCRQLLLGELDLAALKDEDGMSQRVDRSAGSS